MFEYWVVQKWNGTAYEDTDTIVYPGGEFKVNAEDAKITPVEGEAGKNTYTVQIRAHFAEPKEPPTTRIWWFRNDGTEAFRKDEDLQLNEAVSIEGALTREGYEFIGWAKVAQTGDTPPTTVTADPYLYYVDGAFHVGSEGGTVATKVASDDAEVTKYFISPHHRKSEK